MSFQQQPEPGHPTARGHPPNRRDRPRPNAGRGRGNGRFRREVNFIADETDGVITDDDNNIDDEYEDVEDDDDDVGAIHDTWFRRRLPLFRRRLQRRYPNL